MHVKTIRQKLANFLKMSRLLDNGAREIPRRSFKPSWN
jgi:hypothetical protein